MSHYCLTALFLAFVACHSPPKAPKKQTVQAKVDATKNSNAPSIRISGATILTATGRRIENGVLESKGGSLSLVEKAPSTDKVTIAIDGAGKFVTPGLIDAHSHLGVYATPHAEAHSDGNEMTSPTTPHVKARYAYWPQDPGIRKAVQGGVTTALILPGSANLIGGEGFTVMMRRGTHPADVAFPGAPRTIKMACGENPKRVYGGKGGPQTRMAEYAGFRKAFAEARNKAKKQKKKPKEVALDAGTKTLVDILDGKVLVQIHCYRSDDIMQMVAIADEFKFSIRSFHHGLEAYKVRDILARKKIGVNTWADWWGFKMEAFDGIPHNAGLIEEAGGLVTIHSDSAIGIQHLNQEAAKAMHAARHAGIEISETQALQWITKNAAWVLGIDNVVGTLEVGKRADYVVWDAPPLTMRAKAVLVVQGGEVIYDASKPQPVSDFELGQDREIEQ